MTHLYRASPAASGGGGGGGGGTTPTLGTFNITGMDIIDPAGKKFLPIGANVGVLGFGSDIGDATGHSADALAWGWNCVRLNLMVTDLASWAPLATGTTMAQLLDRIMALVNEYTAKGIVVIPVAHDDTYGSTTWAATAPKIKAFWTQFVPLVKDNPYVWLNPVNEAIGGELSAFLPFCQDYYDFFRTTLGAKNIVVFDLMERGEDAGWWNNPATPFIYDSTQGPTFLAGKTNVLFSLHDYGRWPDQPSYANYVAQVKAAGVPMIAGEYGYIRDNPSPNAVAAAQALQTTFAANGIGCLWWHSTYGGDGMLLKTVSQPFWYGGNNAMLSPAGQALWDFGHATHSYLTS